MRKDVGMGSEVAPVALETKPEAIAVTPESATIDPPISTTSSASTESLAAHFATTKEKSLQKPLESRVARDESLARFMDKSKAFHLLGMPEFKVLVELFFKYYWSTNVEILRRLVETYIVHLFAIEILFLYV